MARKYNEITKDVLFSIAVAGSIAVAATSPFFLINIANVLIKKRGYSRKRYEKYKISKTLDRLRRSRLIILKEKGDKFLVELTEKGKRKVKEINLQNIEIKKPFVWDGVWRVVIFDIPDKKKVAREALREKLKEFKFYQLQKSVWVSPYLCEKEIELLAELFNISPYVNFMETKKIKNDLKLKIHFKFI